MGEGRAVERGQELSPGSRDQQGTGPGCRWPGARQMGLFLQLCRFPPCAKSLWVWMEETQDRWAEIPQIRAWQVCGQLC